MVERNSCCSGRARALSISLPIVEKRLLLPLPRGLDVGSRGRCMSATTARIFDSLATVCTRKNDRSPLPSAFLSTPESRTRSLSHFFRQPSSHDHNPQHVLAGTQPCLPRCSGGSDSSEPGTNLHFSPPLPSLLSLLCSVIFFWKLAGFRVRPAMNSTPGWKTAEAARRLVRGCVAAIGSSSAMLLATISGQRRAAYKGAQGAMSRSHTCSPCPTWLPLPIPPIDTA